MPKTPDQAKPGAQAGARPMVERGDHLYFKARGKPFTGKVLSHGEHGCTLEVKGQKHKVRWEHVLGVKMRVQPALSIVDQGEDGFVAKDQHSGKLRYVHDPIGVGEDDLEQEDTLTKALQLASRARIAAGPSAIERIMLMRQEQAVSALTKALKGAPGLALQQVTDKKGHQTQRWKKTGPDEKKPKHTPKAPDPAGADRRGRAEAGAMAGYGTHNLGPGDEISFEAGDFKGEGKIVASGRKGATVTDKSGRQHKVDWTEVRGHKKPDAGAKLTLPTGGKGGGKKPPEKPTATGGDGEPKQPPKKAWTPPEKFIATNYAKEHDDPEVTPESIMSQFPPDTANKIAAVQERLGHVEETIKAQKRDGRYTAERLALHRKIIHEGITARVVNEDTGEWEEKHFPGILSPEAIAAAKPADGEAPTFTMLGGRGGSGKSWFSKSGMVDPKKAIFLDSDHIKSLLPEYEGWNAAQVHEESGEIFDEITAFARTVGLNLVHDATMKSGHKAVDLVQKFKDKGYRTEAHYMHLPRQEAAKRAVGRFLSKTQRYVPVDIILGMTTNEDAFDKVRQHVDSWSFRDNNVARGKAPVLISESPNARRPPGDRNT